MRHDILLRGFGLQTFNDFNLGPTFHRHVPSIQKWGLLFIREPRPLDLQNPERLQHVANDLRNHFLSQIRSIQLQQLSVYTLSLHDLSNAVPFVSHLRNSHCRLRKSKLEASSSNRICNAFLRWNFRRSVQHLLDLHAGSREWTFMRLGQSRLPRWADQERSQICVCARGWKKKAKWSRQ